MNTYYVYPALTSNVYHIVKYDNKIKALTVTEAIKQATFKDNLNKVEDHVEMRGEGWSVLNMTDGTLTHVNTNGTTNYIVEYNLLHKPVHIR